MLPVIDEELKTWSYWMIQEKERKKEERGHHYPDTTMVNTIPYLKPLEGIHGPPSMMTHPNKTYQPPEIELFYDLTHLDLYTQPHIESPLTPHSNNGLAPHY